MLARRQILHGNSPLGIPVFNGPRPPARGVRKRTALPHVVASEHVSAANPSAVADSQCAAFGHAGFRKTWEALQELKDGCLSRFRLQDDFFVLAGITQIVGQW